MLVHLYVVKAQLSRDHMTSMCSLFMAMTKIPTETTWKREGLFWLTISVVLVHDWLAVLLWV